jgi:drug/metabolite transporter (DMT)-like permease
VTDSLAAITARRLGTLLTVSLSLLVSVGVLAAGLLVTSAWPSVVRALPVVGIGVIAAIANVSLWQALRYGPVSVVSPIAATVGAVTVLLAMVLLGEEPGPIQLIAVPVALCGSVLAAVEFRPEERRPSLVGPGPVLAVVAMLCYSLAGVLMGLIVLSLVLVAVGQLVGG